MKVAMVAPDKSTEKGIAMYSINLSEAIRKAGIDIDYVSYKKGSFYNFLKIIPKLREYDIVHIQHEYGLFGKFAGIFFIPLIIILGLTKKGVLIITMHTVHSKKEKLFPHIPWWSWTKKNIIYPIQNKLIDLFSSKIVVHTNFLLKILTKTYGIDKSKVVVLPQGVPDNIIRTDKRKAKKQLNLSGNVYLMIGHVGPLKGIDIILKLARKIGKTIVITGHPNKKISADYIKKLQNFIKKNNLEKIVRFDTREFDSKTKLWHTYFSAADLVLMPYRKMTTSSIFNDAMAYRKPVIASNKKFFREIFKKYKCLEIVKRNTDYPKIIHRCMNQRILSRMEKECEKYAKENSLSIIAQKYKLLYEKCLK
jgi:glycosyltransferase involved in cell wall biosynthesis